MSKNDNKSKQPCTSPLESSTGKDGPWLVSKISGVGYYHLTGKVAHGA